MNHSTLFWKFLWSCQIHRRDCKFCKLLFYIFLASKQILHAITGYLLKGNLLLGKLFLSGTPLLEGYCFSLYPGVEVEMYLFFQSFFSRNSQFLKVAWMVRILEKDWGRRPREFGAPMGGGWKPGGHHVRYILHTAHFWKNLFGSLLHSFNLACT